MYHATGTETECNCLEGIYGRELSHRAANALQQAIAAVSACRRGDTSVLDLAMLRLSAAADLQRMLALKHDPLMDLAELLAETCAVAVRAAGLNGDVALYIDADPLLTDSRTARPILMIAAELVGNSVRHAFEEDQGSILVIMNDNGASARLVVEDTGRCGGWRRAGGQGAGIIDDLAHAMGGNVLRTVTNSGSSRVVVNLPSIAAAAAVPAGVA
jgi:two-component sensor histidine kinase